MKKSKNISIEVDLIKRLEAIAKQQRRSVSSVIEGFILDGLKRK